MFKFRKSDEEPAMAEIPQASAKPEAANNGLGVPPFRPAQPTGAATVTQLNKDSQMARPPFAATPTTPSAPMTPTPVAAATPARPAQASGPRPATREGAQEKRTLTIGRGISLSGSVNDAERLVVEGHVEASMIHANEVSVSPGGVFKGAIEVEDAEVAGSVEGTVTAKGSMIVRATGIVNGTVHCRRLQVEDGGQINGDIKMITEQRPKIAAVAAEA